MSCEFEKGTHQDGVQLARQLGLDWNLVRIPQRYHVTPQEPLTLYKACWPGLRSSGIASDALRNGRIEPYIDTRSDIESEDSQRVARRVDWLTDGSAGRPVVFASRCKKIAEFFLEHTYWRRTGSLYTLELEPERCVLDIHNTGQAGPGIEAFILGAVMPEDIIAETSFEEFCAERAQAQIEKVRGLVIT